MATDEIQDVLDHAREMLKAGVDRFSLPSTVMMDLLDQADHLEELHRHKLEYGIHAVLNYLPDDGSRERFLLEVILATPGVAGVYELPQETHTGCFWKKDDAWCWFIRLPDGRFV